MFHYVAIIMSSMQCVEGYMVTLKDFDYFKMFAWIKVANSVKNE